MSTEPVPGADPVDVAEQEQDVVPPEDDGEADPDADQLAAEADEADAVEQQTGVPGWDDDADAT
jgi:hypothetical protein